MAISKDLPGVEVAITAGGRELREHDCIELKPVDRTIDHLIAATSNQIFAIKCTANQSTKFKGSALVFFVSVDGQEIDGGWIGKTETKAGTADVYSFGLQNTTDTLRKYRFTDVDSVVQESSSLSSRSPSSAPSMSPSGTLTPSTPDDSDSFSIMSATTSAYISSMNDLGTIRVEMYHAHTQGDVPFKPFGSPVPSRIKKMAARHHAVSHIVSFGRPERTAEMYGSVNFQKANGTPGPDATFIFHYRSSKMLRSMLGQDQSMTKSSPPSYSVPAEALADRLQDLAVSRA